MNFLLLGDIFPSAISFLEKKLPRVKKKNKIDFVIANGENSAPDAKGITKKEAEKLFKSGIDVLTSGNHIWDKRETLNYLKVEKRILRPANMSSTLPGAGCKIYKKGKKKICVMNLMANYYMPKCSNIFKTAQKLIKKMNLKKNVDFIIVDIHGEFAAEKMALGHFYDGKVTSVFGTHTHVPTSDSMILSKGTSYQTDLGMCGNFNSVIGLKKEIFLKKFLRVNDQKKNEPAKGSTTICGSIVKACEKTGLAISIKQLIVGSKIKNFNN